MTKLLDNVPLAIFLRMLLGLLFIGAAIGKILNPGLFAHAVYNYKILDPSVINLVAIYLPWVEILTGVALLIGVGKKGASLLATGMMVAFLFALCFNLLQGREFDCGCFPAIELPVPPIVQSVLDFLLFSPDMMVTIWRDVLLLLIALYVLFTPIVWKRHVYMGSVKGVRG